MLQVCLAAETCGHVDFNTRGDVWYSSEPFHCGDVPPGHVTYWQIFHKVGDINVGLRACMHSACMHSKLDILSAVGPQLSGIAACEFNEEGCHGRALQTAHTHWLNCTTPCLFHAGGADGHLVGLWHSSG
jgi:hypothetical protein